MAMVKLRVAMYIVLFLSIFLHLGSAPGGGGGGGRGGGGCSVHRGSGHSYHSSHHHHSHSSNSNGKSGGDKMAGLVIAAIFGGVALCWCCILCWVQRDSISVFICGCCKKEANDQDYTQPPTIDEWLQSEKTSKEQEEVDQPGNTVFIDGKYAGRYLQYGIMHDFPPFQLNFATKKSRVWGSGSEEVGRYNISGKYNPVNNRMAITQKFMLGTGDPTENLGHSVFIRLEWNANEQEFEGKWYCKTHKYAGVNKFWIKPVGVHQAIDVSSPSVSRMIGTIPKEKSPQNETNGFASDASSDYGEKTGNEILHEILQYNDGHC